MTIKTDDLAQSQGADDARPDAAEQAPATTPDTPSQAPVSTDPDALELATARAEVEAEAKAGEAAQKQPEPATVEQQPAQQQAPSKDSNPSPEPRKRTPVDEVIELRRALRIEREKAAYLQGALEATRGSAPATPAPAATEAPAANADPIATEIAASRASLREQAKRFDRGEITLDEYEGVRAEVEDKILALQTRRIQEQIASTAMAPEPGIADQAIEETHLTRLYDSHVYAANLTTQQAQALADMARTNLAMAGKPIGTGRKETLRLREEVARLSDVFGPQWGVTPRQTAPAPDRQQQQPAQPKAPPTLSPAAQARQTKMGMAAGLPPDPAGMGMAASTDFSEAQILRMSDEQILALPAQVRMRILNSA